MSFAWDDIRQSAQEKFGALCSGGQAPLGLLQEILGAVAALSQLLGMAESGRRWVCRRLDPAPRAISVFFHLTFDFDDG